MTHHICLYLGGAAAGLAYVLGWVLACHVGALREPKPTYAERVVRRCLGAER